MIGIYNNIGRDSRITKSQNTGVQLGTAHLHAVHRHGKVNVLAGILEPGIIGRTGLDLRHAVHLPMVHPFLSLLEEGIILWNAEPVKIPEGRFGNLGGSGHKDL